MLTLACGVVGLLVWGQIAYGPVPPLILLMAGVMLIALVAWWLGSEPYRIGGGRGELRVYDDHIEVPGVGRGTVVRLPRADLALDRRPVRVQLRFGLIPVASLERGELLTLRSAGTTRVLSTLTSPAPDFADRLVLALMPEAEALMLEGVLGQFGEMFRAHAPKGTTDDTHDAEAPNELDRRIDEELARLDD